MDIRLLNTFDTPTLAVLVVGVIVALSVLAVLLVRRRYPGLAEGEHNDMIGTVLGMFGAIYGIILAFVIVTLWTQLDTTNTIVASESTAAATLVRDAGAFPPAERDRIREATGANLQALYDALQSYEPGTETEKAYYGQATGQLDEMVLQRRARIAMATKELPLLLQVLVYGGALVIIPLTFLCGVRSRRMQVLFVGTVAMLIGFSPLLTLVLDRPFSGDLSASSGPFKEGALTQFWK
ncbi:MULTISPECIES: DUF4239 domain-containing protein [Kitasatospora]|uniref:DUF4239 domain-containing protein n=1 Tax=Kitasatospora setae (strain ATCC 33774 / DSM 43861 / JCM 3304 / KCC A-0304 / NBRC 14216 / KM-6054) TaxID=452652 RepID=E4MYZ9_KITSK|nr:MULTISPECIES: DUF4239 domain-containing protein [Kitasatospora]BAJ25892.1 hypothetical protein KSE_00400t [Kitasatospora setae KM-6054]BAJ33386.1 hypothetical protein KSE_76340t [Kitasatospora setae KM-6054]